MKTSALVSAVAFGFLTASAAQAQDGAGLVSAKGCLNCHALDQKKIGPSFKDIAGKAAGNANAAATMVGELKDGKGHPKVAASDPELQAMVAYVLSTGK